MTLENKTILIVSPQNWGKMFISKHHYAIELAKRGNTVYFLNPPDQTRFGIASKIRISASSIDKLLLIEHSLYFPYWLKFKANRIFHLLMRFHVKNIVKSLRIINVVWSFDIGNLYPLPFFEKSALKIFHPVDEPLNRDAIRSANGADIIFSVTHEILEKYKSFDLPRHFINHGVSEAFLGSPSAYDRKSSVRIGFSGNLLRKDIDRPILLQIIAENPSCLFEFWGSYQQDQSNISGTEDSSSQAFISTLKHFQNVLLHGPVTADQLAKEIQAVDAFLICYDVIKDQSKGTNYHKVMEYLATGKLIVSNNITTYKDNPELVAMVTERDSNEALPLLFANSIKNLSVQNSYDRTEKRINFALNNTYSRQLAEIEKILLGLNL